MSAKRSRVHPKYKTQYRISNWALYDQSLVKHEDLTIWISEDAITQWTPSHPVAAVDSANTQTSESRQP